MVVRIEDDPDLLAALSEEEVDALLAAEGIRATGVRAAVRRRVREAPPARSPARRIRPFTAAVWGAVGVIALASLWWMQQPSPLQADDVLAYETTLDDLVRPPSKALEPSAGDLMSEGAQALLEAAQDESAGAALEAAAAFEQAYALASSTDDQDRAAFFAGLANGLAGAPDEAATWFRRVSPEGEYAGPATDALDAIGH